MQVGITRSQSVSEIHLIYLYFHLLHSLLCNSETTVTGLQLVKHDMFFSLIAVIFMSISFLWRLIIFHLILCSFHCLNLSFKTGNGASFFPHMIFLHSELVFPGVIVFTLSCLLPSSEYPLWPSPPSSSLMLGPEPGPKTCRFCLFSPNFHNSSPAVKEEFCSLWAWDLQTQSHLFTGTSQTHRA